MCMAYTRYIALNCPIVTFIVGIVHDAPFSNMHITLMDDIKSNVGDGLCTLDYNFVQIEIGR